MKDTIIKGSGNSMSIRSVPNLASLAPAYEDFLRLLSSDENGLPIDLGPLNPAGCDIVGDALNKANLLKDATAALYGKTAEATPDEIFAAIRPLITAAQTPTLNCRIQSGSYAGTGAAKALSFSFTARCIIIVPNTTTATDGPLFIALHGGVNVTGNAGSSSAGNYYMRGYGGGAINGTSYNVPISRAGVTYYWMALGT